MPRRRRFLLIAAGLAALPVLAGLFWLGRELLRPLPPTPTPSPPLPTTPPTPIGGGGGLIVFETQRDGNLEIYVMAGDGSGQINLTRHSAADYAPAWSPDGRRLAFLSDRGDAGRGADLYLMDADGGGLTRVTDGAGLAPPVEWSPDGRRLLARQAINLTQRLFVVDVDGSGVRVRTVDPIAAQESDLDAHWSPDGQQVAALRIRGTLLALYLLDEALNGPTVLAETPAVNIETFAWSPDGSRIAFVASQRAGPARSALRITDPAGGPLETVRQFEGLTGFHGLAWSPDGRRLALAWADPLQEGQQLHILWADGSGLVAVTAPPGSHPEAHWSPDSRRLLYTSHLPYSITPTADGPHSYIYTVDVERAVSQPGSLAPQLLTTTGQDSNPVWQP